MKHTTTAPMILEALEDEGVKANERAPYLSVQRGPVSEILISAQHPGGRSYYDLPVLQARGFDADEFDTREGEDGATCVYTTDVEPKSLEEEARAMAAAVNRAVRGATGYGATVLLAAPLVPFMTAAGLDLVRDQEARDRAALLLQHAELREDGAGALLVRPPRPRGVVADLFALKTAFDHVWGAYADAGTLSDGELTEHGVRPYMIRAARGAVHDRWMAPLPKEVTPVVHGTPF